MQKDLTAGSVFKNVLYFSLPYLLSYFLQTLYGMADLFIIGQFEGTASITAVSIGSQIMHMITVMLVGLAMGVTVGIGRAVGAHDDRGAGAVIGNAVTLFLAVSVAMAAVLTALVQPILSIMSTPAEAVPGAAAYLKRLRARGVKCVVATATPARLATIGLNCADLVSDLDFIFSTDMLNLNKSQNEFFERVSQIIGVPKEDCVMFEDSLYAMQGARNAGLGVIGMTDATNTRDREAIRACCDRVIDSFDELP